MISSENVECPECGGVHPEEVAAGTLSPSVCRCGYFHDDE